MLVRVEMGDVGFLFGVIQFQGELCFFSFQGWVELVYGGGRGLGRGLGRGFFGCECVWGWRQEFFFVFLVFVVVIFLGRIFRYGFDIVIFGN